MSKVIIYTAVSGNVEIVIPAPQSLAWGRFVLTANKKLVFPGGNGEAYDALPNMLDVADKKWAIIVMQLVAKNLELEFTLDMVTLESEEDHLDRLQEKVLPIGATNVQRIEVEEVPTNRAFRDAWRQDVAGKIETDMPLARDIHMQKIRNARVGNMHELDIQWNKHTGQGNTTAAAAVESQRQELRDLPETFDLSVHTTPEELYDAWPAIITRPERPQGRDRNNVVPINGPG